MQLLQPSFFPQQQAQIHSKESSTQSDKSSESGHHRSSKQLQPITKKEIDDMNAKIKEEISGNKKRYEKLLTLNPYFSLKLYQPVNTVSQDEYHSGTLKKMMKQIDMLLDEGSLIEKEIKKSELRRMQSDYLDPTDRNQIKNHYAYLRKIWVDFSKVDSNSATDKIQELNKKVVIMKNNIFKVAEHEKRCYDHLEHYENVDKKVKEMVVQSEEYRLLKERFEQLTMTLAENQSRFDNMKERYEQKLIEKGNEVSRAWKQAQEQKRINKELKEKALSKEQKLLQKIAELESQIKLKTKLYSNMKENNQSQNHLKFLKEDGYINQIKFRKLDIESQLRKGHFDTKDSKETNVSDKVIADSAQTIKEPPCPEQVKDTKEIQAQTPEDVQQSLDESMERNFIRENKSIDNKRGRFSRMRSPANGKLIKPSEPQKREAEFYSPRVKEFREEEGETLAVSSCQV